MGSDLLSGPNAAQKWANVLFAGTNIEQIVNLSQLLGDFGCFNEELLPDVIHCGSKVCVSGPQWSERGKNKKNLFLVCKSKGSEAEAEFNTAAGLVM